MSNFKKILALVLVVALSVGAGVMGTLAYLTSTDSDVNVMTMGNVSIKQHEYQREQNADGSYVTGTVDDRNSYILEEFEQAKPLLPIVGDPNRPGNDPEYAGFDETTVRMSQVGSYGGMQVFAGKNAQDKFVVVENDGITDAYIRTIVAIEIGSASPALIGTSYHQTWTETEIGTVTIDGTNYFVIEYLYNGGLLSDGTWRHEGGILPAGDTAYPSLAQVYLKSTATNEDCKKIDGNGNGTLDILVLSQAVQAAGFADAQTALDTAFGKSSEKAAEWLHSVLPTVEVVGTDRAAILDAINQAKPGEVVKLTSDVTIAGYSGDSKLIIDKNIILDLGGYTITTECGWGGIDLKGGASIVNGTINHTGNTAAIKAFDVTTIENVTINVTETAGKVKGGIVVQAGDSHVGSIKNVTINGATNGIEFYNNAAETTVGTMDNVKINALQVGLLIGGGGNIDEIKNCDIVGATTGIQAQVKNLWHVSLNIVNSRISGTSDYGIDFWDEGAQNTGSTVTFVYDEETVFSGGKNGIKITLGEEIECTENGKAVTTEVYK